jgi:hypothetical protein
MAGMFAALASAMLGAAILAIRFGHMLAATIALGVVLHLPVLTCRLGRRGSGSGKRRCNQPNHDASPEFE